MFDVVETLGRLQIFQQAVIDRDRLERVTQQLGHTIDVVLAFDVVADRGDIRLIGENILPFLRQHVVEPQLGGVRVAGLFADEAHARQHQGIVFRIDNAERRVALGASSAYEPRILKPIRFSPEETRSIMVPVEDCTANPPLATSASVLK